MCRLFAYGPSDAVASQNLIILLPHLNPDWCYLSGTSLPRLSWKRGRQMGVVVVVVVVVAAAAAAAAVVVVVVVSSRGNGGMLFLKCGCCI